MEIADSSDTAEMRAARATMVAVVRAYGVRDARVLAALQRVRRHCFFPGAAPAPVLAYGDHPFAIGYGQTISQPFIVACMSEALALKPGDRVLEIGAGSGYQTAVLASLGAQVFSVEIVPELAAHAQRTLASEGFGQAQVRCADGYDGWRDQAPFDAIIATCAPAEIPTSLTDQLGEGGRMVIPVGVGVQRLVRVRRTGGELVEQDLLGVRFVPMVHGG